MDGLTRTAPILLLVMRHGRRAATPSCKGHWNEALAGSRSSGEDNGTRGSALASPLKHDASATAPQSAEGRLQRADRTAAAAAREDASTERFSRTQARACSAPTQCTESEAKATMASAT